MSVTSLTSALANAYARPLAAPTATTAVSASAATTAGRAATGDSLTLSPAALQALEAELAGGSAGDGTTATTAADGTATDDDPVRAAQTAVQRAEQAFLDQLNGSDDETTGDPLVSLMDSYAQQIGAKNDALAQAALARAAGKAAPAS